MTYTTATLSDFDEQTQEVRISYELEQDNYDRSIYWVIFLKVLDPVTIDPSDIVTDLIETISLYEGRFIKKERGVRIEVGYLELA